MHAAPLKPQAVALRTALAIGTVGRLGEELINCLLETPAYASVHVAVEAPLRSMLPRLRPWQVAPGTFGGLTPATDIAMPRADDVYCCIDGTRTYFRRDRAYLPLTVEQLPALARTAARNGARRFVLLAPLSAFLQLSAPVGAAMHVREVDLVGLGFETLIVVRPTADYIAGQGNPLERLIAWGAKAVMEIIIPPRLQPLRARHIAQAAINAITDLGPGVHILGAARIAELADRNGSASTRKK
ncbi:MAG: hypothetical protein WDZ63_17330 [Burkholderiales bacterium]